ncbi:endonuclease/exonuclease/phosphatase family protein [Bifidobacterium santillanense]
MTIIAAWVLVCIVWILLSALPAGLEARMPMPYLIALIPFLWVPSLVLAALAAWAGEWGAACPLLVVALSASSRRIEYWGKGFRTRPTLGDRIAAKARGVATGGTTAGGASREASRDGGRGAASVCAPSSLRLMTLNCRYGRADADQIVREVRGRGIDVLALQEVSDDLLARLDAAGIGDVLPYRQSGEPKAEVDNGGYNVLFSAYEPAAATASVVMIPAADVPAITLRLADGRTATIASAHPRSPMRGCADWSAGIIGLGELARAEHIGDRNIAVVMGDLNSSTEHPSFRALLRSGFRDASLTQGRGPNLTFPRWTPWPRIELDHILATPGVSFRGVESFVVNDTDHLALTGTIALKLK